MRCGGREADPREQNVSRQYHGSHHPGPEIGHGYRGFSYGHRGFSYGHRAFFELVQGFLIRAQGFLETKVRHAGQGAWSQLSRESDVSSHVDGRQVSEVMKVVRIGG